VLATAQDGAGALLAYATLLAVVATTATSEARGDADEQRVVDVCARSWLHASGLLLFCAAGLRGYLPGGKPKKPQPYLARVVLVAVGLGFFWRAAHFHFDHQFHTHARATDVANVAAGTMLFLGTLAIALSVVSYLAARRLAGLLHAPTPRERFLRRRTQQRGRAHAYDAPGDSSSSAPLLGRGVPSSKKRT